MWMQKATTVYATHKEKHLLDKVMEKSVHEIVIGALAGFGSTFDGLCIGGGLDL